MAMSHLTASELECNTIIVHGCVMDVRKPTTLAESRHPRSLLSFTPSKRDGWSPTSRASSTKVVAWGCFDQHWHRSVPKELVRRVFPWPLPGWYLQTIMPDHSYIFFGTAQEKP